MTFGEYRRRHRGFVSAALLVILAALGADAWLLSRQTAYEQEIARLRAGMNQFEKQRTDAILDARARQRQAQEEEVRRQALADSGIHIAVDVDSGRIYLERRGALLRRSPVEVGPGRRIGIPPDTVHLAVPRGTRTVQAVLGARDAWEVPDWVYRERKLPVPEDRHVAGALGPVAVVLDGGTVLYSIPATGPLADSAYVLPGSVRMRAEDLDAIMPNVQRGTAVYFY